MYKELTTTEVEKIICNIFIITNHTFNPNYILDKFKKDNNLFLQFNKKPTNEVGFPYDIFITRKNIYYHFGKYQMSYIFSDNNKPTKNPSILTNTIKKNIIMFGSF